MSSARNLAEYFFSQTFRTQGPARGLDQDAARFFSSGPGPTPQIVAPIPFDLSLLQRSLPQPSPPQRYQQQLNPALASWVSDFLKQQPLQSSSPQIMAPKTDIRLQERERAVETQIGGSSNIMMQGMSSYVSLTQELSNWQDRLTGILRSQTGTC